MGQLINGKNLLLLWATLGVLLLSSAPDANALKCVTCHPSSDSWPLGCDSNNGERDVTCDPIVKVCQYTGVSKGCDQRGTGVNSTFCYCDKDFCNSDMATCSGNTMGQWRGAKATAPGPPRPIGQGSGDGSRPSVESWLWLTTLTPLVTRTLGVDLSRDWAPGN